MSWFSEWGFLVEKSLILNKDDLFALTGFRWSKKQAEVLKQMGIPFKLRPDNTVCVLQSDLTKKKRGKE